MKKTKIFALVDCNNFYVSCERVFNPSLLKKPVVVLSNNDGCAISRSNEAKLIGIPMGAPVFKYKELIKKHDVRLLSANFALYGDMSARVMETLATLVPEIEVYSIDEAFLDITSYGNGSSVKDQVDFAVKIRNTVIKDTGIPVSVGIGSTKTLAKMANKLAKKNAEHKSVFLFPENTDEFEKIIENFPVSDIWGIGRRYTEFLKRNGISTALQFKYAPEGFIRQYMTIKGLQTLLEVNGHACIPMGEETDKKIIIRSQSFGHALTEVSEVAQALTIYVSRACEKLRSDKFAASNVHVFLETNPFKEGDRQYTNHTMLSLPSPSSNTSVVIKYALKCLELIFKKGFLYKKTGVMLTGLVPESQIQLDLFCNKANDKKQSDLMKVLDEINEKFGSSSLRYASQGFSEQYKMRQEKLSGKFTTNWNQIPVVKAS